MSMREIVQSSQKTLSLRNLGAGCREKRTVISRSTITRCVLVLDFANVAQSTAQDFCVDLTPRSGACRCHLSSDQIIRTGSWKLYTMLAEYCTSYRFAESSGRFFTRPNEFIVCFISLVFVLVLGASCSISSRYVRRKKKKKTRNVVCTVCVDVFANRIFRGNLMFKNNFSACPKKRISTFVAYKSEEIGVGRWNL